VFRLVAAANGSQPHVIPRAGHSYISPMEPVLNEGDRCARFWTCVVSSYACSLASSLFRV
jgi:hypothetical protein